MWGRVHALMYKWISVRFTYGYWCSLTSIGIVVFTTMLQHHLSMVIFSLYFSCSEKLVLQFWRYWKLMLFLFYTYRYRSVLSVKLWPPSISVIFIYYLYIYLFHVQCSSLWTWCSFLLIKVLLPINFLFIFYFKIWYNFDLWRLFHDDFPLSLGQGSNWFLEIIMLLMCTNHYIDP